MEIANKKKIYSETAYVIGILLLALGTAMMVRADFGMSMVVAPAYLVHLKVSAFLPFFTFGMAEYCLQFVILAILALFLRRFTVSYLFSFISAVFYGITLDLINLAMGMLPTQYIWVRLLLFVFGMPVVSVGVALLFHTYLPPEAYELFVKEYARHFKKDIDKVKTVYDFVSLTVAVIMSFIFFGFGHFEAVKFGTLICAVLNGFLIGRASRLLESRYEFNDKWDYRRFFE